MSVVRKEDSSMIDERLEGEEPPRHRKVSKKHHVRSDHKHEYEQVCIDGHGYAVSHGIKTPLYWMGSRCRICGRLQDAKLRYDLHEPPEGMRLFEVEDFILFDIGNKLPDDAEVAR